MTGTGRSAGPVTAGVEPNRGSTSLRGGGQGTGREWRRDGFRT